MQFSDSIPVVKDRRLDGMIAKSAPLHWVEAHDTPPKGGAEKDKSAVGESIFFTT